MSKIHIEKNEYELKWMDNLTSKDIQNCLPLKLNMQAYSTIEYFHKLPILPYFDKEKASRNAKINTLVYCREYQALVLVVKEHQDIFDEIPVAEIIGDLSYFSELGQDKISVMIE